MKGRCVLCWEVDRNLDVLSHLPEDIDGLLDREKMRVSELVRDSELVSTTGQNQILTIFYWLLNESK
jgi:hypothetical protein